MPTIILDQPLTHSEISAVAEGARLALSEAAMARLAHARAVVDAIVDKGIKAYGVNTGVGALSDRIVDRQYLSALSHNLIMSHAVGVGPLLGVVETRAIMAAAINNWALGYSGVRPEIVSVVVELLNAGITPEVHSQGSVGYLSHIAHVCLVLVGHGHATAADGARLTGAEALVRIGRAAPVLEAKEGLSLLNGTPCATGLAALAVTRAGRLVEWADRAGAVSFESLGGQLAAFDDDVLRLHASPGLQITGAHLRELLAGSEALAKAQGARTQDALSLRTMPQVHGAVRDMLGFASEVVDRELRSVTDNPLVAGTPEAPVVRSEAHAVGAAIGQAMDALAIAMAQLGLMSERRMDRLVNPLVSRLPAFLADESGATSGFMILQYTALSLVNENRRLAAPAALDGGITSGLQEDMLVHATPASLKLLAIVGNVERVLAIELLAGAQALDFARERGAPAPAIAALYRQIRAEIPFYRDDRPLGEDVSVMVALMRAADAP